MYTNIATDSWINWTIDSGQALQKEEYIEQKVYIKSSATFLDENAFFKQPFKMHWAAL